MSVSPVRSLARAYGIGDAHCGESVHPWLRVLGWGFRRVPPSRARDLQNSLANLDDYELVIQLIHPLWQGGVRFVGR